MRRPKYDIFISYRRDGGAQYARTLQLMLERKGYKVFLDYDELVDGEFSPAIESAIKDAAIYMLILTKGSMDRCGNEGDWLRKEIEMALQENKRIIPINPDCTFDGIPNEVPAYIKKAIEAIQYSEVYFGQNLNVTIDLMVRNRIKPYIHSFSVKVPIIITIIIVLSTIGCWGWRMKTERDILNLKESILFNGEPINWADNVSKKQLLAIGEIFATLKCLPAGEFTQGSIPINGKYHQNVEPEFESPAFKAKVKPFAIGQFEVTLGQWNAIMEDNREGDPDMPIANITFIQAQNFAKCLSNLTSRFFRLPTESEWEYAAKGSNQPEGFMFAGSADPKTVAWYRITSDGHAHSSSDAPATPTINDLFNMSGNVSEWCDTNFEPYDHTIQFHVDGTPKVIRGGNYDSEEYEITVTHREPTLPDTSIPTLGFRIVMSM